MSSARACLLALALATAFTGCRKGGPPAGSAGNGGGDGAGPAPVQTVKEIPANAIIVALDTNAGRNQLRTGILFAPPLESGYEKSVVAVTVNPSERARGAWMWSKKTNNWVRTSLISQNDRIAFFTPLSEFSELSPLPAGSSEVNTQSGAVAVRLSSRPLKNNRPTVQEPEEAESMRDEYRQLTAEQASLAQPPPPRDPRQRLSPAEQQEEFRKLVERRREVEKRLSDLMHEATRLKIRLNGPGQEKPEAPASEPDLFICKADSAETSSGGALVPEQGFIAGEKGGAPVTYQEVRKACSFGLDTLQAWFTGTDSTATSLNLQAHVRTGLFQSIQLKCEMQKAGGRTPESVGFSRAGQNPSDLQVNLGLHREEDQDSTPGEYAATVSIQPRPNDPAMALATLHFKISGTGGDFAVEWLEKPGNLQVAAPAPSRRAERNQRGKMATLGEVQDFKLQGELLDYAWGGGGKFLVLVQTGSPQAVKLDTRTWTATPLPQLEGDPKKLHVAADAEHIYIADRDGMRLRTLSAGSLSTETSQDRPAGKAVLALAAGAGATDQPLLVVDSSAAALLGPDLETLPCAIENQDGQPGWKSLPGVVGMEGTLPEADVPALAAASFDGRYFLCGGRSSRNGNVCLTLRNTGGVWRRQIQGAVIPYWIDPKEDNETRSDRREFSVHRFSERGNGGEELRPVKYLPVFGPGILRLESSNVSSTYPPTASLMTYGIDDSAVISFEAAIPLVSARSTVLAPGAWLDPVNRQLVFIGRGRVCRQIIDTADWKEATAAAPLAILNEPHAAERGKPWHFKPLLSDGSTGFQCTAPPESGEIQVSQGELIWTPPAALAGSSTDLTVTSGARSCTLQVPLSGPASATWQSGDQNLQAAVPVETTRLPLSHDADFLCTADNGRWLVAGDSHGAVLSVIDLQKKKVAATRRYFSGPAFLAVAADAIYRYEPASGILQALKLPDLTPSAGVHLDQGSFCGLFAGRDRKGTSATILFRPLTRTGTGLTKAFRITSGSLALEEIPAGPKAYLSGDFPSFRPPSGSADGRVAPVGNDFVSLSADGSFSAASSSTGYEASSISDDGMSSYCNGTIHATVSGDSGWQALKNDEAGLVNGVQGSGQYLIVRFEKDARTAQPTKPATLQIHDQSTNKRSGILTGLEELRLPPNIFGPSAGSPWLFRVLACAQTGILATVAPGSHMVILRKLPDEAFRN